MGTRSIRLRHCRRKGDGPTFKELERRAAENGALADVELLQKFRQTWETLASRTAMSTRRISEPKGFQLATAEAALQTLTRKDGPRRFLVADEVGLGKTVVARTIISELIKRRRRPLVVFYVSSNLNIAHQNRAKLLELLPTEDGAKRSVSAADRLTLAANPRNRPKHERLHLYTLTPDTSVPMYRRRGGFGRLEERALIFRLLKGRFPSLETAWFPEKCRGNQAREASWNWALQQHEHIDGRSGTPESLFSKRSPAIST